MYPIGTYLLLSEETFGIARKNFGAICSLKSIGVSANLRLPSSGELSRASLQAFTRFITSGICLISVGDAPTSHKQYRFTL
jgi:hypothetical protein